MIRRIIACALVLPLVAYGVFYILPPEPFEPPRREILDEGDFLLADKVGWYRDTNEIAWQVTWGAENGLQLNCFQPLRNRRLKAESASRFNWQRTTRNVPLQFQLDAEDVIQGFTITDSAAQQFQRLKEYPYSQKEIRYQSGTIELVGTLMTPSSPGPYAAVVFIHGSGVSDRSSFWYMYQADFLAKQGFVVLLPDKRGCGKSGGQWHTSSFDDFAQDAVAAVNYLSSAEELALDAIGLVGFSQGGWIAPLAASKSESIDFVVAISASTTPPDEQLEFEIAAEMQDAGMPGILASMLTPLFAHRARKKRAIWWEKNGDFNPLPSWEELKVPALLIVGLQDRNVPVAKSLELIAHISNAATAPGVQVKEYPMLGHALVDKESGWIRQDYLEHLAGWLRTATDSKH